MSQEQFHQTVQMQEEYMKTFLEEAKESMSNVFYCALCMQAKGSKQSCCDRHHFILFSDFDDETQKAIIQDEYDQVFGV